MKPKRKATARRPWRPLDDVEKECGVEADSRCSESSDDAYETEAGEGAGRSGDVNHDTVRRRSAFAHFFAFNHMFSIICYEDRC